MKLINHIRFLLSLPQRFAKLKERIQHLQPVGIIGEIQQIFSISYRCHREHQERYENESY